MKPAPAPLRVDLDEILFRTRNRAYGAYALRRALPSTIARAFSATVVTAVLAIGLPTWLRPDAASVAIKPPTEVKICDCPVPDRPRMRPTPPSVAAPPASLRTMANQPPTPTPDAQAPAENTIRTNQERDTTSADLAARDTPGADHGAPNGELGGTGDPTPTEVAEPAEPTPFELFDGVEPLALNLDEVKGDFRYPRSAVEAGIEGTVVLRVLVGTDGAYVRHVVLREAHPQLRAEVERHVRQLRFRPGLQANRPVKVWVTLPFRFKIR